MLLIPTLLCPKSWEGMSGNETQRFCTYCKKHVHNLEAMSVTERLALLSSPAASICSRYHVAIRRPAKGKEESYYLHLVKHGAGVALVGSAILVLWEMQGQDKKERFYRAIPPVTCTGSKTTCEMPRDHFCERRTFLLGDVQLAPCPRPLRTPDGLETPVPGHVDIKLDPVAIDRLLEPIRPLAPTPDGGNK